MIDGIWRYIMETRYERMMRPQRGIYADTALELWEHRRDLGASFKLYPSGNGVFQVEDLKGRWFVVSLADHECECGTMLLVHICSVC